MASQADSRVAYPGRDSSVFSKLLHAKYGHSTFILRSSNPEPRMSLEGQTRPTPPRWYAHSCPLCLQERL